MMHLPVSKVFISTTGYGRSRKEGKRVRTVTFTIRKRILELQGCFQKFA